MLLNSRFRCWEGLKKAEGVGWLVGWLVGCLFGRKHYVWSSESRADESGPLAVASIYRIFKKGWVLQ